MIHPQTSIVNQFVAGNLYFFVLCLFLLCLKNDFRFQTFFKNLFLHLFLANGTRMTSENRRIGRAVKADLQEQYYIVYNPALNQTVSLLSKVKEKPKRPS